MREQNAPFSSHLDQGPDHLDGLARLGANDACGADLKEARPHFFFTMLYFPTPKKNLACPQRCVDFFSPYFLPLSTSDQIDDSYHKLFVGSYDITLAWEGL